MYKITSVNILLKLNELSELNQEWILEWIKNIYLEERWILW